MSILGKDIKVDFEEGDIVFNVNNDFRIVNAKKNLEQAIYLRLLTPLGSITQHESYGSRIPELVGEERDDETLSLAILYAYEALNQEPRITEIVDINAWWDIQDGEYVLTISMSVRNIQSDNVLNIVVQVS